jgi:Secretion system C-terminal sorting domain/Beta-propeller repeat
MKNTINSAKQVNTFPPFTSIKSPSPLERVGVRFLLVFLIFFTAQSQSWQWGKRGGSIDQLTTSSGGRQEEVYCIVTDSQKNSYTISNVGKNNLNIDGNIKQNFGSDTQKIDVCLSSFSCDGTYRWSKIIGGGGIDKVNSIQIDSQDNIYIAGRFGDCTSTYPPRIDSDYTISQTPTDCSLIFLAKFSSNGSLLWVKRPQSSSVSVTEGYSQTSSLGLSTDSSGNSYWLVQLPAGTYANGAFTTTLPGYQPGSPNYILKYDSNGNFISGTYIDMQLIYSANDLKFARNPYNGYYYFASRRGDISDTAVIGGQTATHGGFVWCFNAQGQFQWLKESSGAYLGSLFWYNFAFDPQNNIYIAGQILGGNFENFLGVSPSGDDIYPFVMKLNPTADTVLWSTYPSKGSDLGGAIVLNGNEVGVTSSGYGTPYTWGSQSININTTNQGQDVIFARLNKDTGACVGLSRINSDIGYDDVGTALAVDASGDYLLGGGFGHQLTFDNNTVLNIGSQSDFFVAKYSTSVCSLSTTDFKEEGFELYPNPVESAVKINTTENLNYSLYNILGTEVKQGKINEIENTIDFSQLPQGTYLLQTTNQAGVVKKVKLLKK